MSFQNRRQFLESVAVGSCGLCLPTSEAPAASRSDLRAFDEGKVVISDSMVTMENSWVRRVLKKKNGVWRTWAFSRADGSDEVCTNSAEFMILLMNGIVLTIDDYRVIREPNGYKQSVNTVVEIVYGPRNQAQAGAPQSILVRYFLGPTPYLRKSLVLIMEEGNAVDRLEVERFRTGSVCEGGGIGQPVFIAGTWFVGLEYPGSSTEHFEGLVTLAHFPGLAKRTNEKQERWGLQSKVAVAGVGAKGDPVDVAFGDYLESIRQSCPTQITVRNKFHVPGVPSAPMEEELLHLYDSFKKNLEPYGVKLDCLQIDQLGFAPETVSLPRRDLFPGGYGPLSAALKARGSNLSVWLPLNGTGNLYDGKGKDVAKAEWMSKEGYYRADGPFQDFYGYFCLANPAFNKAMRATLREIIHEGDISCLWHDFTQVLCSAKGHAHLPTARHGFEANLDAMLDLLDYERRLKPDIIVVPTSYIWLSPWWLMHSNYIWYGASDAGASSAHPQFSPREWEMEYHDDQFFKIQNHWRNHVPVSAMVDQAFWNDIRDGSNPETLREWCDFAMMVCGRGLRFLELHMNPNMTSDYWEVLGKSLRWWRANQETLRNTKMFGGNPRNGELYGFAHWNGDRGILCLRNPSFRGQSVSVPFDKSVLYRGKLGAPFRGRVIYPYVEDLPTQFRSGDSLLLSVPGCTVMLIELQPGRSSQIDPAQPDGLILGSGWAEPGARDWTKPPDFDQDPSLSLTAKIIVQVPNEPMARCDLFLIARSNGALPDFPTIVVNGQPLKVRTVVGKGEELEKERSIRDTETVNWSIRCLDLLEFRGKEVRLDMSSSKNPIPFILESWVVADRFVDLKTQGDGILLPQYWASYRRQTICLLSYSLSLTPLHH